MKRWRAYRNCGGEVVGHLEPSSLRAAQEHFVKDKKEVAGQGRRREVGRFS